jgi:hypothetical protein
MYGRRIYLQQPACLTRLFCRAIKEIDLLYCVIIRAGKGANSRNKTLAIPTLRHTLRLYTLLWGRQRPRWTTRDARDRQIDIM